MTVMFQSILQNSFSLKIYLITLLCAFLCGLICAVASSFRQYAGKSFLTALILLPMIVDTVIMMVNGSIGTGVAVMGAFSLVRFRSVAGKAREIAAIFLSMTAGLCCAAGYVGLALIFSVSVGLVLVILSLYFSNVTEDMKLVITIPESLNFHGVFDDLFHKYTKKSRLIRVKTTNMGSLYKLYFSVQLAKEDQLRAFLDELRQRNGNLEVSFMLASEGSDEL